MRAANSIILALASVLVVFNSQAQFSANRIPSDTLAMVDSWPITTRDLFERLELMPFQEKLKDHDFESVKQKAVESLVAEKLLALSVNRSDTLDRKNYTRVQRVLEKMFIRDAMYQKITRANVEVTPREVLAGLYRYPIKRTLLVVPCTSADNARHVADEWRRMRGSGMQNAEAFSSFRVEADTLVISFGSADPDLEDAAYALKDSLSVAGPIRTDLYGVLVISLLRDEPNPEAAGKSIVEREEAVRQAISNRKEAILAGNYLSKILQGNTMEADTGIFVSVARRCWQLVCADSSDRHVETGYRLLEDDLAELSAEFEQSLESPIAQGSFGKLSLGDFLENLKYYDFAFPSLKPRPFIASFFGMMKKIVENEIVAREGIRRGYQTDPEVMANETEWGDYWKSRQAEAAVRDTSRVRGWEPIWSLWRYNTALVESTCVINVQELLRPDSLSAAQFLPIIRDGANVDSLVQIYSIRKEWKLRGGRSGWFRFWDHPQIAVHALAMNVGDVAGPLRLEEGFSDFRLLGLRFAGDTTGIHELLEQETRRVRMAHRRSAVNQFIVREALSHHVEFFYTRIKDADIEDINMVTRHTIGFGGRMNAAPVLIPQWQWVKEWQLRKQLLQ